MLLSSQDIDAFSSFNDALQHDFQKFGTIVDFTKKDNPFDVDSTIEWFYIIVSGKVKVYDINFNTNREQTLYLLVQGDMYDVVPLLDNREHNLATEILEPGRTLRFPISKVREWMTLYPKFEQLIYRYVAKQMRQIEELSLDLSLLETKDRLLKLLIKNYESIHSRGIDILDKLSNAEIASLIGTVRHIIDRHLKNLRNEGLIESGTKKKHQITNLQKVLQLLENIQ